MLPMPLSRNASPRAAAARPPAPRVVDESWTVTAATPANTTPKAPTAAPAANEPAAGCPVSDPRHRQRCRQREVGADRDDECGGQGGMAADDGGADQLGAPRLLVLPCVAHDGLRAHQRREDREHQIAADQHGGADADPGGDAEDPTARGAHEDLGLLDERLVRLCRLPASIPAHRIASPRT